MLRLKEAVERELERRRQSANARFYPFQADPIGFVETGLLGFLWSKQREICESVLKHRRTAVKSCHDVGKSAVAARLAAWWISVWPPGEAFVITLAPTAPQVKTILWREINRVHAAAGLPGRTNQIEWWIDPEIVGYGRSPADTDPTAIQGIHARRVLVIFDEACGIAKALWDAADSLIANDDSRFLAIGNPDDPNSEFFNICKPGSGWNTIRISAFDSPNLTDEIVPQWLRPLLVSETWINEKRKSWGESSPLYASKVLGEFPEQAADGLLSLAWITAAVERELPPGPQARNELGVDVARFGGDASVIYHMHGDRFHRLKRSTNRDLMWTCGLVVEAIRDTGAKRVKIDDIGMGGGVVDRLLEIQRDQPTIVPADVQIIGVNVASAPERETEELRFKNKRAELNWALRERFRAGLIDIDGGEDELLSQAAQIRYQINSTAHIVMESKEDMKKRTQGVSPDDWDALVLAAAEPSYPGAGFFDWMKEQGTAAAQARGDANNANNSAPATRLVAPAGINVAYGFTGKEYRVGADGTISVADIRDVGPLINVGFTRA